MIRWNLSGMRSISYDRLTPAKMTGSGGVPYEPARRTPVSVCALNAGQEVTDRC